MPNICSAMFIHSFSQVNCVFSLSPQLQLLTVCRTVGIYVYSAFGELWLRFLTMIFTMIFTMVPTIQIDDKYNNLVVEIDARPSAWCVLSLNIWNNIHLLGLRRAVFGQNQRRQISIIQIWQSGFTVIHTRRRKYNDIKPKKRTNCFNTKAKHEKWLLLLLLFFFAQYWRAQIQYCSRIDEMQWLCNADKTVLKTKTAPLNPFIHRHSSSMIFFLLHYWFFIRKSAKREKLCADDREIYRFWEYYFQIVYPKMR